MAEPVENAGSLARDQLANERTFLAWVRTGLGFVGVGVVLNKLVDTRGAEAVSLALLFMTAGIVQLVYGLVRYRRVARLLTEGQYAPAQRGPFALVMFCIALAVGAAVMTLL